MPPTYRDVIQIISARDYKVRSPTELIARCAAIREALMREQGFKTVQQLLVANDGNAGGLPLGEESTRLFAALTQWLDAEKKRR